MTRALAVLAWIGMAGSAAAAVQTTGEATTAGGVAIPLLEFAGGARARALGDSMAAGAEGPEAVHWNPAGTARTGALSFALSRATPTEDVALTEGGLTVPIGPVVATAAALLGDFGVIEQRDVAGVPVGKLRYDEFSGRLAVAVSHPAWPGARAWTGAGYQFGSTFGGVSLAGYSVGSVVEAGSRLTLGMAAFNLGATGALPMNVRVGAAWRWHARLTPHLEARWIAGGHPVGGGLGVESFVVSWLALRIGYRWSAAETADPLSRLGAGMGLWLSRFGVDYAFTPSSAFGADHRVSIEWGRSPGRNRDPL